MSLRVRLLFRGVVAGALACWIGPGSEVETAHAQQSAQPVAQQTWIADQRVGCRVWNPAPKPNETVIWSGACRDGLAEGRGVLQWFGNDGFEETDDGEWRAGKRSGHGAMTWAIGDRFEGEFRDDNRNGRGVYTWANGDRYEGEYRDDNRNGRGVLTFANGNRYEGEYRDDKRNGHGVMTSATTGSRYEGEWRADKRDGRGVFTQADGTRYDGEWRGDKPNGRGVLQTGGNTYRGVWTDGCFQDGNRRASLDGAVCS